MHKPVYVFSHDANPSVDPFKFRISRHDARDRVTKGYVVYLSESSVQEKPPPGWSPDCSACVGGGLFNQAWMPRWSAHYLVWQMRRAAEGSQ